MDISRSQSHKLDMLKSCEASLLAAEALGKTWTVNNCAEGGPLHLLEPAPTKGTRSCGGGHMRSSVRQSLLGVFDLGRHYKYL